MKIALLGYGKMGKTIEQIALDRGHEITIRANNTESIDSVLLKNTDVAIEFSHPQSAARNINLCFDYRIPVVVGTTGWPEDMIHIKNRCLDEGQSFFYASNFSIGVNIFNEINNHLSRLIEHYPQYKASIEETHHIHKVDKPSGTAIKLAEGMIENNQNLNDWKLDEEGVDIIKIHSERIDDVPGTHKIKFESDIDSITLIHEAKNRLGFGYGAVLAAEFLIGKIGNYSMNDLIKFNI